MKSRSAARGAGSMRRSRPGAACFLLVLAPFLVVPALATAPTRSIGEEPGAGDGWLGIYVRPAVAPEAGGAGVVVIGVLPLSPADRAGLRPGDVILACDQQPCHDASRFLAAVGAHRPGDGVRLTVLRDTRTLLLPARLGAASGPLLTPLPPGGAGDASEAGAGEDRRLYLGIQVIGLTESLAPYFKSKPQEGVLVTHVDRDGPAARAGLLAGDIIRSFAGQKLRAPVELRAALGAVGTGKHEVRILRRGKRKTLRMVLLDPAEHGPWEDVAIYLSRRDLERLHRGLVDGEPAAWRDLARLRGEVEGLRATLRSFERDARRRGAGGD